MTSGAVSVILPTFNRAHALPRAVASVLAQSHGHLELIIVDNGSTDGTRDVVAMIRDPRIRYERTDTSLGPAAARNRGIRAARHPFIAFQDSDDEWRPGKLEEQLRIMADHPDVDLVSCGLLRHGPKGDYRFPPAAFLRAGGEAAIRTHAVAFAQTWLARRALFERSGVFNERLRIWEDWEFLLRLVGTARVVYMREPLVEAHWSPDSVSADDRGGRVASLREIIDRHGGSSPRAFRARLHYLLGRFEALSGDTASARRSLLRSLQLDPLDLRPWAILGLAALGPSAVRAMIGRREARARNSDR